VNETVVLLPEQRGNQEALWGMIALFKPMERMRAISSQLKSLCEVNFAVFILKHMWVPVCHCMGKFAAFDPDLRLLASTEVA
jgi:hypothetical protein